MTAASAEQRLRAELLAAAERQAASHVGRGVVVAVFLEMLAFLFAVALVAVLMWAIWS